MNWLVKLLFPFLSKWALTKGAKVFRGKYSPQEHAMKSRKFMWDNHWRPKVMDKAARSPNQWDDIGADFVYTYNANWIEDGTLAATIRTGMRALQQGDTRTAEMAFNGIAKLAWLDGKDFQP